MSDNYDLQQLNAESQEGLNVSADVSNSENALKSPVNHEDAVAEENNKSVSTETSVDNQKVEISPDVLNFIQSIQAELNKQIEASNSKKDYLNGVFSKYNTDNYFKNDSFKDLYKEAFNALGTNLDTEKFIGLLDQYVNSRIDMHSREIAANKENDSLTDEFDFKVGSSNKNDKKTLRLQDIPDDELEKYISKYV